MLQKERIKGPPPHPRGGFTSFAAAKVRLFRKLTKLSAFFFEKRCKFAIYTLYIIYAREEGSNGKDENNGKDGRDEEDNVGGEVI